MASEYDASDETCPSCNEPFNDDGTYLVCHTCGMSKQKLFETDSTFMKHAARPVRLVVSGGEGSDVIQHALDRASLRGTEGVIEQAIRVFEELKPRAINPESKVTHAIFKKAENIYIESCKVETHRSGIRDNIVAACLYIAAKQHGADLRESDIEKIIFAKLAGLPEEEIKKLRERKICRVKISEGLKKLNSFRIKNPNIDNKYDAFNSFMLIGLTHIDLAEEEKQKVFKDASELVRKIGEIKSMTQNIQTRCYASLYLIVTKKYPDVDMSDFASKCGIRFDTIEKTVTAIREKVKI